MSKRKDYYDILGVTKDADESTMKKAYRKLAFELHPDRNADNPEAEERFKEVSEAYAVLSDADKRRQYDQIGAAGFGQRYSSDDIFGGTDWRSVFDGFDVDTSFFSNLWGGSRGRAKGQGWNQPHGGQRARPDAPAKGSDVRQDMVISFDEAIRGAERRVNLRVGGTDVSVNVRIPAGVEDGKQLRLKGRGYPGAHGGPPGDLYLRVQVSAHPLFELQGRDIHVDVTVSIGTAVLGGRVEVPTMSGSKRVSIPAGTRDGTRLRLRGLGVAGDDKNPPGNQFVTIRVDIPSIEDLSPEQAAVFEQLRSEELAATS